MNRMRHRWRLATTWAVVVALFFHVTVMLTPSVVRAADGVGNTVVLCSSYGMFSVALADLDGGAVPDVVPENSSVPMGSPLCPICVAAQFVGTALPSIETVLPAPGRTVDLVLIPRAEDGVSILLIAGSGPRASPSFV